MNTNVKKETINHPEHYLSGGLECIEVMREVFGNDDVQTFCRLNAFKYLWRANKKGGTEDIRKASWYLTEFLATVEDEEEDKQ